MNAGENQTVAYPSTISLNGTVSDDGLPDGTLATQWSKASGPGTVTFGNAAAVDTTATFSAAGTYVLRLTAGDGALQGTSEVTITLTSANNNAPVVSASADRTTVMLGETVNLTGTATDDGLPSPPGALTYKWTIATGPNVGTVEFGNENALKTTATFSDISTYTLRLTASDGELSAYVDVTVTVVAASSGKAALLVTGGTALSAADAAVRTRLENAGFVVTAVAAENSSTAQAEGKALVVISSTVTSSQVGSKFRTTQAGVLAWEAWLYDDLGMTGPTADASFGLAAGQMQVTITTPSHSMAAHLSGTVAVTTSASEFMWGAPNANAIGIATLAGDTSRPVIFGYERGAAMPGLAAPGRRVGFFLSDGTASLLNGAGWALFEAAVAWASSSTSNGGGQGSGTGLTGEYYDDLGFAGTLMVRTDPRIAFEWGTAAPDSSMSADAFSVRWTGLLEVPATGTYTFYPRTDDGVRLWIDGQLLVDAWADGAAREFSGAATLTGGTRVGLKMEYYERSGDATAELRWSGPGLPKDFIPTDRLHELDSDGDGVSDAHEGAAGTDPNDPLSLPGGGAGTNAATADDGGGSSGTCGAIGIEFMPLLLLAVLQRHRRGAARIPLK